MSYTPPTGGSEPSHDGSVKKHDTEPTLNLPPATQASQGQTGTRITTKGLSVKADPVKSDEKLKPNCTI